MQRLFYMLSIASACFVGLHPSTLDAQGFDAPPPASGRAPRDLGPTPQSFRNSTNSPTTIAPAKRPITSSSQPSPSGPKNYGSPWSTLAALSVVMAFIVVFAFIFNRHGPIARLGLPAEAVEVLGKRSIDQRQAIHLVRLGTRILVLGTSPNGLRTLAEIVDPVEVDYLAGLCRQPRNEGGLARSFGALFVNQWQTRSSSKQNFESADQRQAEQELARRLRKATTHAAGQPSQELRDELPAA